jgi:hypothetical protein
MRRREVIIFVGAAALGWTVTARAQPAGPMPVIGLLTLANLPDWAMNAIRTGLGEAGFVEGRNLTIVVRSAEGQFDRLPALAADLVKSEVKGYSGDRLAGPGASGQRYRRHPTRRKSRGYSLLSGVQVRIISQPQDGEGAWALPPASAARERRHRDRIVPTAEWHERSL